MPATRVSVTHKFDVGGHEAARVAEELKQEWWQVALNEPIKKASVALVFDATAMRWHGAQAGYARTYELDVASGSDTVAGVVIVGARGLCPCSWD